MQSEKYFPGFASLEITEIYIFHIFEFFLPPKVNSTRSKGLIDNDGDIVECSRYSSSVQ